MNPLTQQILSNCAAIAPELILIATLLVVVLADVVFLNPRNSYLAGWIALAGLILSFAALLRFETGADPEAFRGAIRLDSMALFFQKLFVIGAGAIVLFSIQTRRLRGLRQGEYYALLIAATLGAMFLAAANDFMMLILALETLSLSSYVLAGYLRDERESSEASIKYVLYGAVASGIMLFGLSYLYGMTGSLRLAAVFDPLAIPGGRIGFMAALAMVFAGIGFKISAVPFHNWTPDVYEGSPTPVTAYLAIVSKAAGFAILIRLLSQAGLTAGGVDWQAASAAIVEMRLDWLFWLLAVATMTVGNLAALRQTDMKRMLAYSSIAHAGYLLMAFTVFDHQAVDAALFYFIVYYIMTLGAFYVCVALENKLGDCEMASCRGLWVSSPFIVIAMTVFMVSLVGMPPTAGFIGKLKLFKILVDAGLGAGARAPWFYFSLALIGVANSVVSLYYYFKVVKAMSLEDYTTAPKAPVGWGDAAAMGVLVAAALIFGLYFTPLNQLVNAALHSVGGAVMAGGF